MEFSKGKARAPIAIYSNNPEIGAYDLLETQLKSTAMLEKTARIVEKKAEFDTFGIYDKENRPRAQSGALLAGGNVERLKQQNEEKNNRLIQYHEKELAKLQAKLSRSELLSDGLVKERNESRSEVTQLKIEIRNSVVKENALRSSLEKAELESTRKSTATASLRKQHDSLTESHNQSRKKRDLEITTLKEEVKELKKEMSSVKSGLGEEGEKLVILLDDTKDDFTATRTTLTSTVTAAHQLLSMRAEITPEAFQELQNSHFQADLLINQLQNQLILSQQAVEDLHCYSLELESEKEVLLETITELSMDNETLLQVANSEREERGREKEWRQRNRSEAREAMVLKDEIRELEALIESDRSYISLIREDDVTLEKESKVEKEIIRLQIETMELEMTKLRSNLSTITIDHESALVDNLHLAKLHHETEQALHTLEIEHEGLTVRTQEVTRLLEVKEAEVIKLRAEKVKSLSNLGLHKSAETSLVDQLDCANAEIIELRKNMEHYSDLEKECLDSQRRLAAAENLVLELSESNNDLLSHNNPHQKIRGVEQMRNDLIDSRKAHQRAITELETKKNECTKLQRELEAYRAVVSVNLPQNQQSTRLASTSNRIRVVRPLDSDEEEILPIASSRLRYNHSVPYPSHSPPASNYQPQLSEDEYDLVEEEEEIVAEIISDGIFGTVPDGMDSPVVRKGGRDISEARRDGWSSGSSGGRSLRERERDREAIGALGRRGPMTLAELL